MLLRFGVSNHLSIRDRQELSLVASSLKDRNEGLIACPAAPSGSVVPAAVIYGANAAGKTNIVDAMATMRRMVLTSQTKMGPDEGVPRRPFALAAESESMPTCFDIDFVMDGARYHYGFEASDEAFVSEWLYTFPKGYRRTLFARDGDDFLFGRRLSGPRRIIANLTRSNSLYVSAAAQYGHKLLTKVFRYFRSFGGVRSVAVTSEDLEWKKDPDQRVIDFLGKVGTGIVEHRRDEVDDPEEIEPLNRATEGQARSVLFRRIEILENTIKGRLVLGHQGRGGEPVFFNMDRESAGTRRLLVVLGRAFRALDKGHPLCIDELDASLHTHASEAVLKLFCSPDTNPKGAQVIATTHDTNLMNSSMLRRDQIWLTEKDAEGATTLYPLTDIRTRRGDDFAKGYRQGRYGAVPPNVLIWASGTTN